LVGTRLFGQVPNLCNSRPSDSKSIETTANLLVENILSDGEERISDAKGDCEPDQSEVAIEATVVLPDVPEATVVLPDVPRQERLQVPLHEREPPTPDADLRPEPHAHR
jgi:hypothetical protein